MRSRPDSLSDREAVASVADSRVSFISEADRGQADALNRAIGRARGRWILWVNADDFVDSGAVNRIADQLTKTTATLVYGDFSIVDVAGCRLRSYECPRYWSRATLLNRGLRVFSGSIFIDRQVLSRHGGFDDRFHYCMDYELLVRIGPDVRLQHVPGIVGSLRIHPESKSSSAPWRFFLEYRYIQSRYRSPGAWACVRSYYAQLRLGLFTATSHFRYSRRWARIRSIKRL